MVVNGMAAWLIENEVWLIGAVVLLVVGIKMAAVRLLQRLATADAANNDAEES